MDSIIIPKCYNCLARNFSGQLYISPVLPIIIGHNLYINHTRSSKPEKEDLHEQSSCLVCMIFDTLYSFQVVCQRSRRKKDEHD